MLYRSELKKSLITHRGILILVVCLLLKAALFWFFPEQKDSRILLSQKQYDKYLAQLHGADTPEKSEWIRQEYENCESILDSFEITQKEYYAGNISDEDWEKALEEKNLADLHINSSKIFAEKAEQFMEQPENLPPAHYIYEYGWQTVFTLLQFPDFFLLFAMLLLTSESFSAEASGGMLPVLLAARNGRRKLYNAKLLALLSVGMIGCALSCAIGLAAFSLRGFCNDPNAPLYSVTILTQSTLPLSLQQGLGLCMLLRPIAVVLLTVLLYGLSIWVRSTTNLIFLGLCVIGLPLLWNGRAMLYTHSGLLSATRILLWLRNSAADLIIPVLVVAVYSGAVGILAEKRHSRGM